MRALVTGSRAADSDKHADQISRSLGEILSFPGFPDLVLVHGACPTGVDAIVEKVCHGYTERHPADWYKYGRAAGPIRNQAMVDLGADLCLAFPLLGEKNHGTFDCKDRAERAGIPTTVIWLKP